MFLCLTWTIKGRSACPFVALPNRLFVFPTQSTAVTERVKQRWTPKFLKSILQDRSSKLENGDAIYRQLERNFNVDILKGKLKEIIDHSFWFAAFPKFRSHFAVFRPSFPRPLSLGLVRNSYSRPENLRKPPRHISDFFIYCFVWQIFKVNFWIRGTIFNSR